jgi:uncharacterized ParB-like nuclease family protein
MFSVRQEKDQSITIKLKVPEMKNKLVSLKIDRISNHPLSPNKISKSKFLKLKRNIEMTGLYEPLTVRIIAKNKYQIINGHHRIEALRQLGYEKIDCIVWDIASAQTELFLCTLNRLCGRDKLKPKKELVKKLNKKFGTDKLKKLLPYNKKQLERLCTDIDLQKIKANEESAKNYAQPIVFFLEKKDFERLNGLLKAESNCEKIPAGRQRAKALMKLIKKQRRKG